MKKLLKIAPLVALLSIGQIFATERSSYSIHDACHSGNLEEIKLLIEGGANVDETDDGYTPLHRAAYRGDSGVAELLLEFGASVDKADNQGRTPLHFAADGVGFVAQDWVDPEYAENCHKPIYGREKIAYLLIQSGATIDKTDNKGNTPLHLSAGRMGSEKIAELLLKYGASINRVNNDGKTPLHLTGGNHEMVDLLLKNGANIYQLDNRDWTPLYLFAACLWEKSLETALQHGADINKEVKNSKTLLEIAEIAGDYETAATLRKYGAKRKNLFK